MWFEGVKIDTCSQADRIFSESFAIAKVVPKQEYMLVRTKKNALDQNNKCSLSRLYR